MNVDHKLEEFEHHTQPQYYHQHKSNNLHYTQVKRDKLFERRSSS